MEYRDLYDENKKLTGDKIKKENKIPGGKYYLTVIVFIENKNNEFLLQINKKFNLWSTTGGHPKSGKSSLEGIKTECYEELGLDIDLKEFNLFKTIKTEDDFVDLYYVKKDIDLKKIKKENKEVEDVKWFSKKQITNLIKKGKLLPSHIAFYLDCLNYLKQTDNN
ncbi:MAG: NUDIX domain-containing protein [Mollicutes bacterium]|nr:NUDIX domain-containing protein [Mollicutes bacterium]